MEKAFFRCLFSGSSTLASMKFEKSATATSAKRLLFMTFEEIIKKTQGHQCRVNRGIRVILLLVKNWRTVKTRLIATTQSFSVVDIVCNLFRTSKKCFTPQNKQIVTQLYLDWSFFSQYFHRFELWKDDQIEVYHQLTFHLFWIDLKPMYFSNSRAFLFFSTNFFEEAKLYCRADEHTKRL